MLLVMVVATVVGMLVEVGCVGVVFESSGGVFLVVVLVDFGIVLRGVAGGWLCGVGMRGGTFCNALV